MKSVQQLSLVAVLLLSVASAVTVAEKSKVMVNPIEKVIQLISDLQQKIIGEGEAEQKAYEEFAEWCEDTAKEKGFEIKTATAEAEEQTASIEKAASDIDEASTILEELAGKIGTDEADLKAASLIREKEQGDFEGEAKELTDTIDTLARAQSVLEKELGGAAFVQKAGDDGSVDSDTLTPVLEALSTIIDATTFSEEDRDKLAALLQQASGENDGDGELDLQRAMSQGAPDPAAYKSKSGSILDTLADMQEKAEGTLDAKQKKEMEAKHNFEMLKQSLVDAIAANKKELADTKKDKAEAEETKATSEGELAVTNKDLAEDKAYLHEVHGDCMAKATAFETAVAERDAELKTLAIAKKIIVKTTGGAADQSYSFAQMSMTTKVKVTAHMRAKVDATRFKAVRIVKDLAREAGSVALAQLADRIAHAVRFAGEAKDGADPFAKVKGMIQEMLEKLLKEAGEEAAKKAYCDKEMSETKKSKEAGETRIEDLTTRIDKAEAKIATLKEEVTELSKELAALVKGQAEMDKLRMEENEEYKAAKAELEKGLNGVEMALKVLKDYYAKADAAASLVQTSDGSSTTDLMQAREKSAESAPASGAAGGIIGMLEVAASDFSKNLADMTAEEDAAQEEYEKMTQENKVTKATKEQDVKYKTKERKSLEKYVSQTEEDRDGVQTELNSVLEYYEKLKPECISKPEPYEERKKRREAEIEGLKEALSILEGEAPALMQTGATTHHLRGIQRTQ